MLHWIMTQICSISKLSSFISISMQVYYHCYQRWAQSWSSRSHYFNDLILKITFFCVILILKTRSLSFFNVAYGKHRRGQVIRYFMAPNGMESELEKSNPHGAQLQANATLKYSLW